MKLLEVVDKVLRPMFSALEEALRAEGLDEESFLRVLAAMQAAVDKVVKEAK